MPLRLLEVIVPEQYFNHVYHGSRLSRVFLVMVVLSAIVAAVGLLRNNVAVIIGAMVIAPLLGPNVALSLAAALGDGDLGRRAVRTAAAGSLLAFGVSLFIGLFAFIDPGQPEIHSRTIVSYADILLALASGIAGALAFTTGAPAALIGVMMAVAPIPPLVTSGLLLVPDTRPRRKRLPAWLCWSGQSCLPLLPCCSISNTGYREGNDSGQSGLRRCQMADPACLLFFDYS